MSKGEGLCLGPRLGVVVLMLATGVSPACRPEPGAVPALCGHGARQFRRAPAVMAAERERNMGEKYL